MKRLPVESSTEPQCFTTSSPMIAHAYVARPWHTLGHSKPVAPAEVFGRGVPSEYLIQARTRKRSSPQEQAPRGVGELLFAIMCMCGAFEWNGRGACSNPFCFRYETKRISFKSAVTQFNKENTFDRGPTASWRETLHVSSILCCVEIMAPNTPAKTWNL